MSAVAENVTWKEISRIFDGKHSPNACAQHFSRVLCPNNTSTWTLEDDVLLLKNVANFGDTDWYNISYHTNQWNPQQVRQRYLFLKRGLQKLVKEDDTRAKRKFEEIYPQEEESDPDWEEEDEEEDVDSPIEYEISDVTSVPTLSYVPDHVESPTYDFIDSEDNTEDEVLTYFKPDPNEEPIDTLARFPPAKCDPVEIEEDFLHVPYSQFTPVYDYLTIFEEDFSQPEPYACKFVQAGLSSDLVLVPIDVSVSMMDLEEFHPFE
jgi:hypothetical protein